MAACACACWCGELPDDFRLYINVQSSFGKFNDLTINVLLLLLFRLLLLLLWLVLVLTAPPPPPPRVSRDQRWPLALPLRLLQPISRSSV